MTKNKPAGEEIKNKDILFYRTNNAMIVVTCTYAKMPRQIKRALPVTEQYQSWHQTSLCGEGEGIPQMWH